MEKIKLHLNDYKQARDKALVLSNTLADIYSDAYMCAGPDDIQEKLQDAVKQCNVVADMLNMLSSDTVPAETDGYAAENVLGAEFAFDEEHNVMHIRIPGKLPPRQGDKTRGLCAVSDYKRKMKMTFASYFCNHGICYTGKVLISFFLHYRNPRAMRDHDNVDPKAIIDEISAYMLKDDSPTYCSLRFDGAADGEDLIEVTVSPEPYPGAGGGMTCQ